VSFLRVNALSVAYGKAYALRGVSLHVEEGESVAIIGPNGAGKTTLLRAISGLVRPADGDIWFDNVRLDRLPPHEIVRLGIAHAPEHRRLAPQMTVLENLELGAYHRRDRKAIRQDMEHIFELFPRLRERLGQHAGTLSGGEQQMLTIARALMARPRLLLLDEPSLGLAPLVKKSIFDALARIQQDGVTVLLAEQDASLALPAVSRAYVLESGRMVMEGPSQMLRQNDYVRQTYLGL